MPTSEVIHVELDNGIGLVAYCTVCNNIIGGFPHKGAISQRIAKDNGCPHCDALFSIMPDGDFYHA